MAREFNRTDRLADAIQRLLAQAIQFEVRDPRVGMVNINDVEVSRDLSHARVFVTYVDRETDDEIDESTKALNKASGFLRSVLAKELDIRMTPRLSFIYDKTSVKGQALSSLIDRAVKEDRSRGDDSDAGDSEEL
jgi:ribosome-binding factor A